MNHRPPDVAARFSPQRPTNSGNCCGFLWGNCANYQIGNIRPEPENRFLKFEQKFDNWFNELIWLKFDEPFEMSLVQAPRRLTTFWLVPNLVVFWWIIIFNSPTRDSRAATSAVERTILTATIVTGSSDFNPVASALTTRPNAPDPNSFPAYNQRTFKYYWCIHYYIIIDTELKLVPWKFPPIFVGKVLSLFVQWPFGVNRIRIAFEEEFEPLFRVTCSRTCFLH